MDRGTLQPGALQAPPAPRASGPLGTLGAPRPSRGRKRAFLAWSLAIGAFVLVLAKSFVGDLYAIQSGSMRPTLFGGAAEPGGPEFREHVLVLYDRDLAPQRFDLVVLRSADGGAPLVKRVVGLPGETIGISEGDLLIDGQRLPPESPRPEPIVVFDDRRFDARGWFDFEESPQGPWSRVDDAWRVDALEVPPGSHAATMSLRRGVHDDYLDEDGELVRGARPVNDLVLEGELDLESARSGGLVRLALVEDGDTFVASFEPRATLVAGEPCELAVRLLRYNARTLAASEPADKVLVLAEASTTCRPGEWLSFRFANVDNALLLEVDGRPLARASYEANEPPPAAGPGTSARGARASLGAEGSSARFRGLRLARDLHYTASGTFGSPAPVALGLDEYFLLGDNSISSTDSRSFGPVPRGRLLGKPLLVVWPPGRVRLLEGTPR